IRGRKVSEWFKFLREEQDSRRRLAALALLDTEAGPKSTLVMPGFVKELREHSDPAIRMRIAQVLPKYKDRGEDVAVALKASLQNDKDEKVRAAAAIAIARLERPLGTAAIKELVDALKDPSAVTRAAAAEAIGQLSRIDSEIAKDYVAVIASSLSDQE